MSVTSGFFNSKAGEHDRVYDANQLSSIFDGIIKDGIYATIGGAFAVTPGGGMSVNVASGRAWFDHTWTLNDSIKNVEVPGAPPYGSRIDAIVIEVNKSEDVRENSVKAVVGLVDVDAAAPVKPELINNEYVKQYPLCYISVTAGQTEITESDIENAIGTESTPFVTGIIETINIADLLVKFEGDAENQRTEMRTEFDTWFAGVQDTLDHDTAGHLQNEINDIWTYINSFGNAEEVLY